MTIDVWQDHDKYPKSMVECKCGQAFMSHSRFDGSRVMIVSREKCPSCGSDELRASRDDWELQAIDPICKHELTSGLLFRNTTFAPFIVSTVSPMNTYTVELIKRQGFTEAEIQFTIATSLPDLIEETKKRIIYMPFDRQKSVIMRRPNSVAFDVIHHLASDYAVCNGTAFPFINSYDQIREGYDTVIVPDAIDLMDASATVNVRGEQWTIDKMPLYLERGSHAYQHVYPMFDWSKVQLWAYVVKYILGVHNGHTI